MSIKKGNVNFSPKAQGKQIKKRVKTDLSEVLINFKFYYIL